MKRHLSIALLILTLLLFVVTPVLAYIYYATVMVDEDGTGAHDMAAVGFDAMNEWMADNGFMEQSALDTRIETLGGSTKPHMVSDDSTWFATAVPSGSQTNLFFTTGNSLETSMDIICANDGFITVSDDATLYATNDFKFEYTGYVNVTAGAEPIWTKASDFGIQTSGTTDGDINFNIVGTPDDCLDFVRANSDWVRIPDAADLSFTDGGGNDEPFTFIAWINLDDATSSSILAKIDNGANDSEYIFECTAADLLQIQLLNPNGADTISATTLAVTGDEGTWHHFAATYDATELNTGLELFRDGVNATNARAAGGAYVGMTNNNEDLNIGSKRGGGFTFMEGQMAEVKIYDVGLTPAEILADFNGVHKSTDLVAHWAMDEGVGLPQDSSGNAHHATINLADWINTFPNRISAFLTASGIAAGEHYLEIYTSGANALFDVDGVNEDTVAIGGMSVPSNANDHILGSIDTPYSDNYSLTTAGVMHLWLEPNYMVENTGLTGTETAGGSTVLLTAVEITEGVDYWVGARVIITDAGGVAPEGETSIVTASAVGSVTISPALSINIDIGDEFTLDFGTMVDRSYYGVDFDGINQYIACADDPSFNFVDVVTIEAWINPSTLASTDPTALAVSKMDNWYFGFQQTTGLLRGRIYNGGEVTAAADPLVIDTWQHICLTYDGTDITYYKDGVFVEDFNQVGAIAAGVQDVRIGVGAVAPWAPFPGIIDEVRIYNRVLLLPEITANYNSGVGSYTPSDITDLAGWWHLEEDSGVAAADSSGNGNNGVLTNGPLWVNGHVPRPAGNNGTNDGRITWGVNPTGITVALGSLLSVSTPAPGLDEDDPSLDILPPVDASDWFLDPALATLVNHPLRPFVTIMSDTTTITELQAWRFLGLVFVLFITVGLGLSVREHLLIAGVACAGAIFVLVDQTIWPAWSLVFALGAILVGLISERTPVL